jgi:predicted P-loop ATPase
LDRWASCYLGAEDTPYERAVTTRWLISAVARIFEPGCKADCVLIFEGRQGLGKSTALRILGGEWFADEIAVLGTKDAAMQVAGVWIVELAELDSLTRAAADRVKAFVSRATDRFRPPYGSRVIEQPRQSVFAGSVNHSEYLRDETGARRFWPVACTAIDLDALGRDRDQIWAEARHRYLSGEPWWLDTPDLHAQATEAQSQRYAVDPWQQAIEDYIAGKASVSVSEILTSVLAIPIGGWTQAHENRVARCLRTVGWVRRQRRTGLPPPRDRAWRYFPPA